MPAKRAVRSAARLAAFHLKRAADRKDLPPKALGRAAVVKTLAGMGYPSKGLAQAWPPGLTAPACSKFE